MAEAIRDEIVKLGEDPLYEGITFQIIRDNAVPVEESFESVQSMLIEGALLATIIVFLFLVWFFIGHMIFALFMGLSVMTNVSSSYEVFLTPNGLTMLAVGTIVGAGFALLLYMITVIALPLLLDREVDFVTAMIVSFTTVTVNPGPMLAWGALVAVLTFAAMVPWFLGLFLTLPLLGHATWHLYDQIAGKGPQ